METVSIIYMEEFSKAQEAIAKTLREAKDAETQKPLYALTLVDSKDGVVNALNRKPHDLLLISMCKSDRRVLSIVEEIKKMVPELKVIVMTTTVNAESLQLALDAKVDGQIAKRCSVSELMHALDKVKHGDKYFDTMVMAHLLCDGKSGPQLTKRELTLLSLLVSDKSNKELSKRLELSERAIHFCKAKLRKQFGVKTDVGLVAYAIKNHLV